MCGLLRNLRFFICAHIMHVYIIKGVGSCPTKTYYTLTNGNINLYLSLLLHTTLLWRDVHTNKFTISSYISSDLIHVPINYLRMYTGQESCLSGLLSKGYTLLCPWIIYNTL